MPLKEYINKEGEVTRLPTGFIAKIGQGTEGRPKKGRIKKHISLKPETIEIIDDIAFEQGISFGEAIEFLIESSKYLS